MRRPRAGQRPIITCRAIPPAWAKRPGSARIARVKLLLFDLDGTLLLTDGAGVRAMERAGRRVLGERFTLEGLTIAGGMDPLIYAEAAARTGAKDAHLLHDTFRRTYLEELRQELAATGHRARALPGIACLLDRLSGDPRVLVGMLTGNYAAAVPLKLGAVGLGLERFAVAAFGDDAATREALVGVALTRAVEKTGGPLTARDTIIIGDTPADIRCAAANGCGLLAVATGKYTPDQLRRAGAEMVVEDLSDPSPLLRMIGPPGAEEGTSP